MGEGRWANNPVVSGKINVCLSTTNPGLPRWLSGKRISLLMQETRVLPLGQEDTLQKEMATHSSILA